MFRCFCGRMHEVSNHINLWVFLFLFAVCLYVFYQRSLSMRVNLLVCTIFLENMNFSFSDDSLSLFCLTRISNFIFARHLAIYVNIDYATTLRENTRCCLRPKWRNFDKKEIGVEICRLLPFQRQILSLSLCDLILVS